MHICIILCMHADASLRTEAQLAVKRASELGLTQAVIAKAIGASQSQVSRVLSGAGVRRSLLFDAVCRYVFSVDAERPSIAESKELTRALADVWDGTPEHATALALVIRSLGALGSGTASGRRSVEKAGAAK